MHTDDDDRLHDVLVLTKVGGVAISASLIKSLLDDAAVEVVVVSLLKFVKFLILNVIDELTGMLVRYGILVETKSFSTIDALFLRNDLDE